MSIVALDSSAVQSAVCPQAKKRIELFDATTPGFSLEVRATGGKTYYFRYRDPHGRQRQYRIGDAKYIKLDQARKKAHLLHGRIALGEDPAEQRAALRAVPTFAEFADQRYMPFVKGYKARGSRTIRTCATTCCLRSERNILMKSPSVT